MRKTSIDAYNRIKENKLLGKLQMQVYDVLFHHGPLTQNELHQYHFKHTQARNVQPRVTELVHRGVAEAVGTRPCRITGQMCLEFDVTGELPKPITRSNPILDQIRELKEMVLEIKKAITPPSSGQGQGYFFK